MRCRTSDGLSLAEVMLAMGLLALLLVTSLGILQWALHSSQGVQASTRAAFLAQGKMEDLFTTSKPESGRGPCEEGYAWNCKVGEPVDGFLPITVEVSGPAGALFRLQAQRREDLREVLLRSPSDSRLRRTAEDVHELETLPGDTGQGQMSLTPDGKTLAYVAQWQGRQQIFTRALGNDQAGRVLFEYPTGAQEPTWSPGGTRLAFTAQENGFSQVMVYELKGKTWSNQSRSSHHDGSPFWFPDGKNLVVVRDGSSIVMLGSGGEKILVEDAGGWNSAPAIAPDGRSMAFMSNRDGNPEIYLLALASGKTTRLTTDPAYDTHPRFAPGSGRRILFLSDRGDGQSRVYSMNLDGSQLSRVSDVGAIDADWLR